MYEEQFREISTFLHHLKFRVRDKFKFIVRRKKFTFIVSPGPHTINHALHRADS